MSRSKGYDLFDIPNPWRSHSVFAEAEKFKWKYKLDAIEFVDLPSVSRVIACPWAKPHTDRFFFKWSALLVIRCDGFYISTARKEAITPNVGQVLLLNVHEVHACTPEMTYMPRRNKLFMAVSCDFSKQPSRKTMLKYLKMRLDGKLLSPER